MGFRLRRVTGRIRVDVGAAARSVAPAILKHFLERVADRRDVTDRPLPAYSPLYRAQLQAIGDDGRVDLSRTGGMLRAVRLLRSSSSGARATLVFGAGSSTSARTPRPPPWALSSPEALERWRRAPKKTARSLAHSILLRMHVEGNGRSPARRILGVSPRGQRDVVRALERAPIFRS